MATRSDSVNTQDGPRTGGRQFYTEFDLSQLFASLASLIKLAAAAPEAETEAELGEG